MKPALLGFIFSFQLLAQTGGADVPVYTAYKETVLAAAAEVVTIRTPATGNKSAFLLDSFLYCSVACEVTVEAQGTYSSGNTITPTKGRSTLGTSAILATSGTVITSTTVRIKYFLAAAEKLSLDLRGIFLTEVADALTFRTNAITGTVIIAARWEQK